MKNSILIPVDFKEQSLVAIRQAYNLAKINNLDLTLLYVYEDSSIWDDLFSDKQEEEIIEKSKIKIEKLAEEIRQESGLTVYTIVKKGRVYSEILEVAEIIEASYIFMGVASVFSGKNKAKRIVGANASRVIRSAKCPVVTINSPEHYKGCRSILLPLDLTEETRQKVKYAIDVAIAYNATIKVISVIWDTNDKTVRWKLTAYMEQVKKFIIESGIKCTTEIIEVESSKQAVETILNYAKQQGDIDLIVIMTQKEIGFVDFFVGSKAQEIIRLSDIPVMSITPKELGTIYL